MSSNTKQYTITHKCEYEGEDFSFVVDLTNDEYILVKKTIEDIKNTDTEDEFSVEETNLSDSDIALINKFSGNTYMNRIARYKIDFDNLEVGKYQTPFYKGSCLYKLADKIPNMYVTEIQAIDPETGELKVYAGPKIQADNMHEAKEYCKNNGLGYCKVLGVLHEINK